MDKQEEKTLNLATLVFPVRGNEVMLAQKMTKIGAGYLNGWGGGVEEGETIVAGAAREFNEESGASVDLDDLTKVCIAHFKNNKIDGSVFVCTVHIFTTRIWHGEIISTPAMAMPRWHPVSSLRYERLMPADYFLLERILSGETGEAWAEYTPFQESLVGNVRFVPGILKEE